MTDRRAGRISFDAIASQYDAARPEYPPELYDTLVERTGITKDSRLLEVGPGPGIATRAMARRGYRITALELGENMAAVAR
ncbi:MAG TPA: rRNA adenine N-6-methyltransferase family protein, partial [Acidimicrobiia bacterium]